MAHWEPRTATSTFTADRHWQLLNSTVTVSVRADITAKCGCLCIERAINARIELAGRTHPNSPLLHVACCTLYVARPHLTVISARTETGRDRCRRVVVVGQLGWIWNILRIYFIFIVSLNVSSQLRLEPMCPRKIFIFMPCIVMNNKDLFDLSITWRARLKTRS